MPPLELALAFVCAYVKCSRVDDRSDGKRSVKRRVGHAGDDHLVGGQHSSWRRGGHGHHVGRPRNRRNIGDHIGHHRRTRSRPALAHAIQIRAVILPRNIQAELPVMLRDVFSAEKRCRAGRCIGHQSRRDLRQNARRIFAPQSSRGVDGQQRLRQIRLRVSFQIIHGRIAAARGDDWRKHGQQPRPRLHRPLQKRDVLRNPATRLAANPPRAYR